MKKLAVSLAAMALVLSAASAIADVVGVDWRVPLDVARTRVPARCALQGNLDPMVLFAGDAAIPERPLLNHLAVLVDSAQGQADIAQTLGIEVESMVDAANTIAAFLTGPGGVRIEYVEHKPTFSLT